MENNNSIVSKKSYRVSFIIINIFLSFLAGVIITSGLDRLFHFTKPLWALFLVIIIWNGISVYFARKIWVDGGFLTVYDEDFKKTVGKYRNLILISISVMCFPAIFFILNKYGLMSKDLFSIVTPTLFFAGIFMFLITPFYFSGVRNVSMDELARYPFQFIKDPILRKQEIEKALKKRKISLALFIIFFAVAGLLGFLSFEMILSVVIVSMSTISSFKKLRTIG